MWKFTHVHDRTFTANKGTIRFDRDTRTTYLTREGETEETQLTENQLVRLRFRLDNRIDSGKLSSEEHAVAKALVGEICLISARSKEQKSDLKLRMDAVRVIGALQHYRQ